MTRLLRFISHPLVKWPGLSLVGLLAVWMIGGNVAATLAERPITRERDALAAQFSGTSSSTSARELARLGKSLGLTLSTTPSSHSGAIADSPFSDIYDQLVAYVDAELLTPSATISPPPPKIRQFLDQHQQTLLAMQQLLATSEPLVFEVDITGVLAGDVSEPLPPYLDFVKLQRLLSADILAKQAQGDSAAALAMAETAWKIHASQQNHPLLIAQLVSQLNQRLIVGTLRKLPQVPPQWQTRLGAHSYEDTLLTALSLESLFIYAATRRLPLENMFDISKLTWDETPATAEYQDNLFLKLLSPLSGPYMRWLAIDSYRVSREQLQQQLDVLDEPVCAENTPVLKPVTPAFWNVLGDLASPSYENLILRTQQLKLDTEFSQRILAVQDEFQRNNRWPPKLPRQPSTVCPGSYWDYALSNGETPTLELAPQPPWQPQRLAEDRGLPLTFRF
ncbi:hypothetical protein [Parathermosynechococcus lividus]